MYNAKLDDNPRSGARFFYFSFVFLNIDVKDMEFNNFSFIYKLDKVKKILYILHFFF